MTFSCFLTTCCTKAFCTTFIFSCLAQLFIYTSTAWKWTFSVTINETICEKTTWSSPPVTHILVLLPLCFTVMLTLALSLPNIYLHVIHAFGSSTLDFCNSLFFTLFQNAGARLVLEPRLYHWYWFPVHVRIQFKIFYHWFWKLSVVGPPQYHLSYSLSQTQLQNGGTSSTCQISLFINLAW